MNATLEAVLIGKHTGTNELLIYLFEGDIPTDAIVKVNDPELVLYVDKDLIETGNSLCWVTEDTLANPSYRIDRHFETDYLLHQED